MALVGTYSLGVLIPALLEGQIAVGITAAQLEARLAGLIELSIRLGVNPPTLDLAAVGQLAASIEAAISVGLPSIDIQASAVAAAILELQATLGTLNAFLAVSGILGTPGIHVYKAIGTASEMASEFHGDLSGGFPDSVPEAVGLGILLAASAPAARVALTAVLSVE